VSPSAPVGMIAPSSSYNRHCTLLHTHTRLTSSDSRTQNADTQRTEGCMRSTRAGGCQATYCVLTSNRSCGAAACPSSSCVCWSSAVGIAETTWDTASFPLRLAAAGPFSLAVKGRLLLAGPAVSGSKAIFFTAARPVDRCAQDAEPPTSRPSADWSRTSVNVRIAGGGGWCFSFSAMGDGATCGLSCVAAADDAAGLQTTECDALAPCSALESAAPPVFPPVFLDADFFGAISTSARAMGEFKSCFGCSNLLNKSMKPLFLGRNYALCRKSVPQNTENAHVCSGCWHGTESTPQPHTSHASFRTNGQPPHSAHKQPTHLPGVLLPHS